MYERGQIYAIIDEEGMEVYIGSTCNELYKRWYKHKNDAKRYPNRDIYKYITENGGFEKFRIVLLEYFPCSCKKELERREGEVIKDINPVGNRNIAGRTRAEYLAEYRKQNRDKIREKNCEYQREWRRKNYEQNKEKINERRRENYRNKKNEL